MDLLQYINLPFDITDAVAIIVIIVSVTLAIRKGGLCEFLYLANLIITLTLAYKACLWISEQLLPIIAWVWLTRSVSFIIIFAILYTSVSSTIQKLEKKLAKKRTKTIWGTLTSKIIATLLGLIRATLIICAFYAIMLITLYQNQNLPPILLNGMAPPWVAKILSTLSLISDENNQLNQQIQNFNNSIRYNTNSNTNSNSNSNQQQPQQQQPQQQPQPQQPQANPDNNTEANTEPYPINPEFNPEQYNNQLINNQNQA